MNEPIDKQRPTAALHFAHYDLVRVHSTLRVTPAMQAGITDHVRTLPELLTVNTESRAA